MYTTEPELKQGKNLANFYFFMQGLGSFLPWSTILSTLDFYGDRFPNAHVNFTFPLANFISNAILIFVMVYVKKNYSLNCRIPICIAIQIVLLISMPIVALILPNSSLGLWLLFLFQFVGGAFNTISNATVVGLAGHFPPECMAKNSTGVSICGLICNLIRALLLCFFPYEGSELSTAIEMVIYYSITAVLLLVCLLLHFKFIFSDYAAQHLPNDNLPPSKRHTQISDERLHVILNENHHTVTAPATAWESTKDNFSELWRVLSHMKLPCLIMVVSNIITNMLTPGVMLKRPLGHLNPAWKLVILVGTFNIFNAIGKYSTVFKTLFCENLFMLLVVLRLIFFYTFITEASTVNVPIVDEEWFGFLNIALFALTDGYITTGMFIMCPGKVEGHDKEIAGFLALLSLLVGIATGTVLALPFRMINAK